MGAQLLSPKRRGGGGVLGKKQPGRGFAKRPRLFGADAAAFHVFLELRLFARKEGAGGEQAGQFADLVVGGLMFCHARVPSCERNFIIPVRMRVLTVPSGWPSRAASSEWL